MELINQRDNQKIHAKNKKSFKEFLNMRISEESLRYYFIYLAKTYFNNYLYIYENIKDFTENISKEQLLEKCEKGKEFELELKKKGIKCLTYFDIGSQIIFTSYLVLFAKGNIDLLKKENTVYLHKIRKINDFEELNSLKDYTYVLIDEEDMYPNNLNVTNNKIIIKCDLNSSKFKENDLIISPYFEETSNEYVWILIRQMVGLIRTHYVAKFDETKSIPNNNFDNSIDYDIMMHNNAEALTYIFDNVAKIEGIKLK